MAAAWGHGRALLAAPPLARMPLVAAAGSLGGVLPPGRGCREVARGEGRGVAKRQARRPEHTSDRRGRLGVGVCVCVCVSGGGGLSSGGPFLLYMSMSMGGRGRREVRPAGVSHDHGRSRLGVRRSFVLLARSAATRPILEVQRIGPGCRKLASRESPPQTRIVEIRAMRGNVRAMSHEPGVAWRRHDAHKTCVHVSISLSGIA